jgi:multimeric flavodoxin WrbA
MRVCGIIGSPRKNGNVDLLVSEVLRGARSKGARTRKIYLNDLRIKPCQSCDTDPYPRHCIYEDDMDKIYTELKSCDLLIVGSPIYFDTVTAQTKLMIDRCNCLMPYVTRPDGTRGFERRIDKAKKGVFVAVGGEDQNLDPVVATIKGFFNWANIEQVKLITHLHRDDESGGVKKNSRKMNEAFTVGAIIADSRHVRQVPCAGPS